MKQTTTLNLYQYDSSTDTARLTSEYIDNMSKNMQTIDDELGPFKKMNLYLDADGDVCQKDL
mgnify:FL=1|nr:MAG TPA: hypothetical protein [Bacteriophage sp.]